MDVGTFWRFPVQRTCSVEERGLDCAGGTYRGEGSCAEKREREDEGKASNRRHDDERPEGLIDPRLVLMVQMSRLERIVLGDG